MNKGLKAIRRLIGEDRVGTYDEQDVIDDTVEAKEYLEALDIILKKKVNVWCLSRVSLERYNAEFVNQDWRKLTQEEYEALLDIFEQEGLL